MSIFTIAGFSFDEDGLVTDGSIIAGASETLLFGSGLQIPALLDNTVGTTLGGANGSSIDLGDDVARSEIELTWDTGFGLSNQAGDEFIIYENGNLGAPEGYAVSVRSFETGLFTPFQYQFFDTFDDFAVNGATDGAGVFATRFDLSDFGIASGDFIDAIRIVNLVTTDTVDGSDGQGEVDFTGASGFTPLDSAGGSAFATSKLDPDITLVTGLNAAEELPKPVKVFDGITFIDDFDTIQEAVDAASAGFTITIEAGTYTESVNIDKALTIEGSGSGATIVEPPSGSGFRIVGDLGTSATLSIDGISFTNSVNGSGVQFDDNAILGTLEITNSEFSGNFRNGLAIGGNSNPVDLDNVILTDSTFVGNGGDPSSQTSSGDGDILFFQYGGDAIIQNVDLTGQVVGSGPAENGIQFRSDTGAIGNVVLDNINIGGVYEKQPIAFFNYDDLNGLSANNVVVTADSTGFAIAGNFSGIGGNFSSAGIDTTGAPDPLALQGDNGDNVITGGAEDNFLRGFGGNDTLNGGDGTDVAVYAGVSTDYAIAVTTDATGWATGFTGVTDTNPGDGDEGVDTFSSVESVIFADGPLDLSRAVQVFDTSNNLVGTFDTIQAGVDAAADGFTVIVDDGTYNENVVISDSITLRSRNGRGLTTIVGDNAGSQLGAIDIDSNTDNVTIGGLGQGFTIEGINGNGAIEKAAVYIRGDNDGITIQDNELVANGDSALTSEFAAAVTNALIDNNIFSGQTFTGANPEGIGFSTQFNVGNNVPRQLVVMGNGGSAPYSSGNITFSNNELTGTAGGISTDDGVSEQGNNLVTIDADTVTFENNTFNGFTNRFATALRSRGPNSSLINNQFDNSTGGNTRGVVIDDKGAPGTYSGNTFTGSTNGEIFTGTPGADDFTLSDGDDEVFGSGGDDVIAGDNGTDTAFYLGSSTDYTITATATSFTSVTDNNAGDGDEGADTLSSIEVLSFLGDGVTLDLTAPVKLFDSTNTLVGTFSAIQAAVDAASDGYTIDIGDGTFREQVTIDGFTDLTLIGNGDTTVVEMIDSPVFNDGGAGTRDRAAVISVLNSENVVVQDVKVDGRGLANQLPSGTRVDLIGVLFTDSSGSLEDSTVVGARDPLNLDGTVSGNQRGNAVVALNTDGSDRTVSILNNEVFDYQKNGISAVGEGLTVSIDSNIVTGNGLINRSNAQAQNGIQVSGGAGGSVSNNVVSEIGQPRDDFFSSYILIFGAEAGTQVTGNTINGTSDPSTTAGIVGIDTDDLNILNNDIDRVLYGLYLTGVNENVDNPVVSGNTFTNIISSFTPLDGGSNPEEFATEDLTGLNSFVNGSSNDFALSYAGTDGPDFVIGSDFDDTLFGGAGTDTIDGGAGNNNLYDESGDNTVSAGDGDDTIGIGSGNDTVDAGDGANFIYVADAVGTNGGTNDITAGSGDDNLYLRGGNNTIDVGDGANLVGLGGGDDDVTAGTGDDFVYSIDGGGGTDSYALDEGNNTVWVEGGDVTVTAGDGVNSIGLADGLNDVTLGNGNNIVYNVNDAAGTHTISMGDGDNVVWMTAGSSDVTVGNGNNIIGLGAGDDVVNAGNGNNQISLIDPDSITDADPNGNDIITTGSGDDEIFLGNGNNTIDAGNGDNLISVRGGTNDILTGTGNDEIFGGIGDDLINPGTGNNTVFGDTGVDTFGLADGIGITTILDFTVGTDTLSNVLFSDVTVSQGTGTEADHTFIENTATNDVMAKLLFVDATDITAASFV